MTKIYRPKKTKRNDRRVLRRGSFGSNQSIFDMSAKIDGFSVENFKSWKNSNKVNFKRINLIYGPNSVGKSAFLQSMLCCANNTSDLRYQIDLFQRRYLELLSQTIDLGVYEQVHRQGEKKGIVLGFTNSESNIDISLEYSKDKIDYRPIIKSFELNFLDSEFIFREFRGRSEFTLVNGAIKFKTVKASKLTKDGFDLDQFILNEASQGDLYEVDCSSLNYEIKNSESDYEVPRFEKLIYTDLRLRSSLIGLYKGKYYLANENERSTETDLNLAFLQELIMSAISKFNTKIVHIPPIRGIPSRISTVPDLMNQDPSVSYVYSQYEYDERTREPFRLPRSRTRRRLKKSEVQKLVNLELEKLGISYKVEIESLPFSGAPLANIQLVDKSGKKLTLLDVGRGISQLLPIIVAAHTERMSTILVEQPEVHIHPKLQADLADLFVESTENQWIIETHSENILFRIQKRIREGKLPADQVQCIYVESINGEAKPVEIGFRDDGSLSRDFPLGFFDIGLEEFLVDE